MSIEQRLAIVEAGLAQVQQKLDLPAAPANWIEQISGSLADVSEEDYRKFLECCRAVRAEVDSKASQQ
jgi:hypothetical protein